MSPLELAILRAVIYASLFDYPLTLQELYETLVEVRTTRDAVLSAFLTCRPLQKVVECRDGYFFPSGRQDLIAERQRREARSSAFLTRHRPLLGLICAVPFVRAVALSGSIAHLNLEEGGDLDLFIVTRGHRVWMVTVGLIALTRLARARRITCANFVLSDRHLTIEQQDLFAASQILHLKPLVGADVIEQFVAVNPFVGLTYPNARRREVPFAFAVVQSRMTRIVKATIEGFLGPVSPLIERGCRRLYSWHLRRRAGGWRSPDQVRLESDALKLHTQSHRRSVMARFERAVDLAVRRAPVEVVARAR